MGKVALPVANFKAENALCNPARQSKETSFCLAGYTRFENHSSPSLLKKMGMISRFLDLTIRVGCHLTYEATGCLRWCSCSGDVSTTLILLRNDHFDWSSLE